MVSFIVIGKNEGWRLEKCFKSIYSFVEVEGIENYEVIYVDSKSTDDSTKMSLSYGNKTILIEGECNAAIGRNIGAKEAAGDILFFIDGDMELIPGFWKEITHEGKLDYPFVSGVENDVLHDNEWNYVETKVRRSYVKGKDHFSITTGGLFVITSDLWYTVGGMRNYYKKSQDLDLGLRLSEKGWRLCRKPQVWVNHYTQYYQTRKNFSGILAKYSALLCRQHFFHLKTQAHLFRYNFFSWILMVSLLLFIVLWQQYIFIPYLSLLLIKTFVSICRQSSKVPFYKLVYDQIMRDILFCFYFFTFYPKQPNVSYSLIK